MSETTEAPPTGREMLDEYAQALNDMPLIVYHANDPRVARLEKIQHALFRRFAEAEQDSLRLRVLEDAAGTGALRIQLSGTIGATYHPSPIQCADWLLSQQAGQQETKP